MLAFSLTTLRRPPPPPLQTALAAPYSRTSSGEIPAQHLQAGLAALASPHDLALWPSLPSSTPAFQPTAPAGCWAARLACLLPPIPAPTTSAAAANTACGCQADAEDVSPRGLTSCYKLPPQPSTRAEEPEAAAAPAAITIPAPAHEAPAALAAAATKPQRRSWPVPRPLTAVLRALRGQRRQQQKPCRHLSHTLCAAMPARRQQAKTATRRCHQHQPRPRACC